MQKILVTGDIGSGKSVFAKYLAGQNGKLISADEIVHRIYRERPEIWLNIETALKQSFRTNSGEMDKAQLARVIFKDSTARLAVEEIVHPLVKAELISEIENCVASYLVYENAVVRDPQVVSLFDYSIEIFADEDVRLSRLVARGLSEIDARNRIDLQIELAHRIVPDIRVENNESVSELFLKADALMFKLGINND